MSERKKVRECECRRNPEPHINQKLSIQGMHESRNTEIQFDYIKGTVFKYWDIRRESGIRGISR